MAIWLKTAFNRDSDYSIHDVKRTCIKRNKKKSYKEWKLDDGLQTN